jgi:lysophospholipase L1-like esterase
MKPIQTLLFLLSVGTLSFALAWVTPTEGFQITDDFSLKFSSLEEDTAQQEVIKKIEDVEAFLDELEVVIDSTAIKDSIEQARVDELIRRQKLSRIQWNEDNRSSMNGLFERLSQIKQVKSGKVRIMHFGDSQIEGDRITSIIRNEIQKEYGGIGPGLIPIVEGVANASIKQSNSDNWNRFTLFGRVDTNVLHKRYGPLCSFGMFTYPTDTNFTETQTAWVQFETSKMTYFKTRKYNNVTLFYGHNSQAFISKTIVNDVDFDSKIVPSNEGFSTLNWHFDKTPDKLRFEFLAKKSPEFYAFSFEGNYGVTVDNIGLRGSSGTLFKRLDSPQLSGFMKSQPIELVILQFGGNSVPYIKSVEKAESYARWFKSQIKYLMRINPNVAFVIIGPSDMAIKTDGEFATYPFLEAVRDALKDAAFQTGAGYWDLYEVMGGKNSMISWVEAETPLAGKDYVHFNNLGTKKVSQLFMKAFWYERDLWLNKTQPIKTDSTNAK